MLQATDSLLYRAALSYVTRGWLVFPCHSPRNEGTCSCNNPNCHSIGKHPRTLNGLKDATTDPRQIEKWWQKWPEANIGIVTGEQSAIFVIDVDGPHGQASLDALIEQYGPLSPTLIAKTGKGFHYLFQYPVGLDLRNSASKLGSGIDIRANGGYVIAPPSLHVLGHQYTWLDRSVIVEKAPYWLLNLLASPAPMASEAILTQTFANVCPSQYDHYAKAALEKACQAIRSAVQGTRNNTLNSEAFGMGQLVGAGILGQNLAEGALLDAALACGLSPDEAKKTVISGLLGGIQEPRDLSKLSSEPTHEVQGLTDREASKWPQPKALPTALPPVEPFDADLLPEAFRGWVLDIANRLQCPPDFPAVGAMVVTAALVGRKVGIHPKAKDNWLVIPNLWGMIVGRPSLKKSPALKESVKQLERLEAEATRQYQSQLGDWQAKELIRKEQQGLLKNDIKKALKNGEDALSYAQSLRQTEESERPIRKRYIVNDVTVEKLGELLSENPNGLLLNRDEFMGFLTSLEKSGHESDRAFYLECWNGDGRFTYDRIGRGTVEIESACLSILGTIQPGPLGKYLRDALLGGKGDDGFIQRFQMGVWPDNPKTWENIDQYPDKAAKDQAYEAFKRLASLAPDSVSAIQEEFDGILTLRFSENAQFEFNEWLTELESRLFRQEGHPAIEAHLAKYRSLVPSLALLIHLVDGGVGPVSVAALRRACAWAEYLESHARRIYSTGIAGELHIASALLSHLKKGALSNPFTVREVQRHNWSGLTSNQEIKVALEVLEEADWIRKVTSQTTGRPREDYFMNPAITSERSEVDG